MKPEIKGIFASLLALIFALTAFLPAVMAAVPPIKVFIDGQELVFDVPPIIQNNRTLVPFRKIGESIGAAVNWDNKTRTITANKGTTEVILKIGSSTAYVNGAPVKLDMPPIIRNNRTLVPLRFFSEAFGASVFWQSKTRVIRIDTGQKPSKHILGYYYSQSYEDFMQNHDKLSELAVKWYTIDPNGDITDNDTSRYILTPQGYKDVIEYAKGNQIKTYMLLFESNKDRLQQVMATQETRLRLINQIIEVIEKEGYDGVNIDFEYLKVDDKERFNQFIKELYINLKAKNKTISLSLPVKTESADWWPGYDYETLGKYSDFVVLMAYDKNPAVAEPQSGIDWVEQVVDYAIARIPASKVMLGIGNYGYKWTSGKRTNTVVPTRIGKTVPGIVFADEISRKYGFEFNIDEKSGLAHGVYMDEDGLENEIWMESSFSVDAKAKLVIRKGLRGIALWRLGYSNPDFWSTINRNFKPLK